MGDLRGLDDAFPVGEPRDVEQGEYDTLCYIAKVFENSHGDCDIDKHVGTTRIRRVLISKIIDEGRSVPFAADRIDQLQYDIFEAVWSAETGGYLHEETHCGDLVIFEEMEIVDGSELRSSLSASAAGYTGSKVGSRWNRKSSVHRLRADL